MVGWVPFFVLGIVAVELHSQRASSNPQRRRQLNDDSCRDIFSLMPGRSNILGNVRYRYLNLQKVPQQVRAHTHTCNKHSSVCCC